MFLSFLKRMQRVARYEWSRHSSGLTYRKFDQSIKINGEENSSLPNDATIFKIVWKLRTKPINYPSNLDLLKLDNIIVYLILVTSFAKLQMVFIKNKIIWLVLITYEMIGVSRKLVYKGCVGWVSFLVPWRAVSTYRMVPNGQNKSLSASIRQENTNRLRSSLTRQPVLYPTKRQLTFYSIVTGNET